MSGRWYARKKPRELYEIPDATAAQLAHARRLLHDLGEIPLLDLDGHIGALTLYRHHVADPIVSMASSSELLASVLRICRRRGLDAPHVRSSRERPYAATWIDPQSISHGNLDERFKPYHYSPTGVAHIAASILNERGDPDGLVWLFGDAHAPGISLLSMDGPLGPIRRITVNGHHRSIALEALGVPLVLAEMRRLDAPFRLAIRSQEEWDWTRPFLRWLDEHAAIRLSNRPIVRPFSTPFPLEVRIGAAVAPWLLASPARALRSLAIYEHLKRGRVDALGATSAQQLRKEWRSVAKLEPALSERSDVVSIPALGLEALRDTDRTRVTRE